MCSTNDREVGIRVPLTPVSRRISRRPRKKFGLAAVDFAKPPAAGEKKNAANTPVQRRLILPTLTRSDKFNASPIDKTKYCRKSDSRRDSDITLRILNLSRKAFCVRTIV